MAYFPMNTEEKQAARRFKSLLLGLERSTEGLIDEQATMTAMLTGPDSDVASFTVVAEQYGFSSTTVARNAFLELASLNSKYNGNGSVSSVADAFAQAFASFR